MIRAKKSLSQNFLIDKNISKKIVKQVNIYKRIVIEIGPGYGFMTNHILENNPKRLILIEKDNNLVKYLKKKYKDNDKIEIIEKDIINFNLSNYKNLIIISNLPYNMSTKIILHLFNFNKNISEMVLMLQKEVAEKFNYKLPKMNKYKFLTKIFSTYKICFNVSPNVFFPKPKVESSIVKFKLINENINISKVQTFSSLIFKNVRKKIGNNVSIQRSSNLLDKRVDKLTIKELLNIYYFF